MKKLQAQSRKRKARTFGAVRLEPLGSEAAGSVAPGGFGTLAFFGMWADREDLRDSGAWVRREREKWRDRLTRQD